MGALLLNIHSETPEIRKIRKVVDELRNGAVILYPTDSGFSLGCELSNKEAIARIRHIRNISLNKELTFLCDSLSNIAEFAKVEDLAYKVMNALIPGPYTFILPASKKVPTFAQNPKRKTAGIRVPDSTLAQLLLKELGQPIVSISAKHESLNEFSTPDEIIETFQKQVDIAVSSDSYDFRGVSTVIDMTGEKFMILREGAGFEKVEEIIDVKE